MSQINTFFKTQNYIVISIFTVDLFYSLVQGDRDRSSVGLGSGSTSASPQSSSLLRDLLHKHQLDAWNSDLVNFSIFLRKISL